MASLEALEAFLPKPDSIIASPFSSKTDDFLHKVKTSTGHLVTRSQGHDSRDHKVTTHEIIIYYQATLSVRLLTISPLTEVGCVKQIVRYTQLASSPPFQVLYTALRLFSFSYSISHLCFRQFSLCSLFYFPPLSLLLSFSFLNSFIFCDISFLPCPSPLQCPSGSGK